MYKICLEIKHESLCTYNILLRPAGNFEMYYKISGKLTTSRQQIFDYKIVIIAHKIKCHELKNIGMKNAYTSPSLTLLCTRINYNMK